jgi:predicted phage tail protein
MTHVKLMGQLGEKFGTDWVSADNNMRDILKLIEAQCEGFADEMMYMLEKDNIGLEIVHGKDLLVETDDDIGDMFLPVIKDTVYITPVPAGSGFGDIAKIILGVVIAIFAPALIATLGAALGCYAATAGLGAFLIANAALIAGAIGGLLALKGLTDYLTPQTPGESPDSYLFGNAQENVKMGSPVPLLYGELIVPGVTINYSIRDQKTTGYNASFTYINSTSNSPANSGGDSTKSHAVVMQK